MGWTSLHREPGMTDREFFENEFPTMLGERGEIVACATVGFTFYAAVRQHDTGETWALVVLTQRRRGYENFFYKEMSEAAGPGDTSAPAAVLDALTPTDDQWSNEWRQACRDRLAKRAAARKVKPGTVIEFSRPFDFSGGRSYSRFRFERRDVLVALDGTRVRIPGWRDRDWTITEEAAA
jgi:hypothetical protein